MFYKAKRMRSVAILLLLCLILLPLSPAVAKTKDARLIDELRSNPNTITETDQAIGLQTTIPRMMHALLEYPEYVGLTHDDVTPAAEVTLGQPFMVPIIKGGQLISNDGAYYYPVYKGDDLLALITLIKHRSDLSATVGVDFVPALSQFIEEIAQGPVAIISYEGLALVAVDGEENHQVLQGTHVFGHTKTKSVYDHVLAGHNIDQISDLQHVNYIYGSRYLSAKDVVSLYDSEVNDTAYAYYRDGEEPVIDVSGHLSESMAGIFDNTVGGAAQKINPFSAVGDYLDGYKTVSQGNDDICWAATVASMIRWERPTVFPNLTARQVYHSVRDDRDYTGAYDWLEPVQALKNYLPSPYVPTYLSYELGESSVRTVINNEDPAYMSSFGSTSRHATALCGYLTYSDNAFVVRIMNPDPGIFQLSDRSYSSAFRYLYGGQYFYWDRTIRLLYSL